jgi:hypothetical protein
MIFYAIYKIQQICVTIGVTFLQIRPWKELDVCNVAPRTAGRRGLPESGELAAALGRGRARGGLGDHLGPICMWFRGGEAGGKGVRWRTGVTAAGAVAPASLPAKGERRRCG